MQSKTWNGRGFFWNSEKEQNTATRPQSAAPHTACSYAGKLPFVLSGHGLKLRSSRRRLNLIFSANSARVLCVLCGQSLLLLPQIKTL
jgi:hypothetical protein